MKIDAPNLNHLWAQLMIEELIRNGIEHFFVAPGSRSSPLALAVAGNKEAAMTVHFDERGLAFAALGCARATGIPSVVITTSGTAVANLFPAVIEASMDHVPMIVLTGDRPPELRDCGANQTIDQVKIFGDYVRWFFDLPCPDEKISTRFVLTTVDQAVARSYFGPVHLNCQFREPLAPMRQMYHRQHIRRELGSWIKSKNPFTSYAPAVPSSPIEELTRWEEVFESERGVVVHTGQFDAFRIKTLADQLGWPLLADIRSNARCYDGVIAHGDQLLLSEKFARRAQPDVVLQFGGRPVSKRIQQWLETARPRTHVVIVPDLDRIDPSSTVTHHWMANPNFAGEKIMKYLPEKKRDSKWLRFWLRANSKIAAHLTAAIQHHPLSEPWIAEAVAGMMPPGHSLTLASSMPVRDAEMFATLKDSTSAYANRGASGIDGTIATAVGVALGAGLLGSTVIIGDLALLHDLNSLAMVREAERPLVIVAINNDGGGIFSFLPVAKHPEYFEKVFGTPHGLGFAKAAEMFGIAYENPTTARAFETAYRNACKRNGPTLIEVWTNREDNVRIHREIQNAVREAVDKMA